MIVMYFSAYISYILLTITLIIFEVSKALEITIRLESPSKYKRQMSDEKKHMNPNIQKYNTNSHPSDRYDFKTGIYLKNNESVVAVFRANDRSYSLEKEAVSERDGATKKIMDTTDGTAVHDTIRSVDDTTKNNPTEIPSERSQDIKRKTNTGDDMDSFVPKSRHRNTDSSQKVYEKLDKFVDDFANTTFPIIKPWMYTDSDEEVINSIKNSVWWFIRLFGNNNVDIKVDGSRNHK